MRKVKKLKERICAATLVMLLTVTSVLPGSGLAVQAADTLEKDISFFVYEEYTDSSNQPQKLPVSDAKVTIYKRNNTEVIQGITDVDGKITLKNILVEDTEEYSYGVTKMGYEASNKESIEDLYKGDYVTTPIEQAIIMSEIEVSSSKIELEKGKTAAILVTNEIKNQNKGEFGYTWQTSEEQVAVVDGNGTITGIGKGPAVITVSRNNQKKEIPVTVKEKLENMKLLITPTGATGNGTQEVTFSISGMPEDASGRVEVYRGEDSLGIINKTGDTWTSFKKTIAELAGTASYKAVYTPAPDENYLKTTVSVADQTYKQKQDLILEKEEATISYGGSEEIKIDTTNSSWASGAQVTYTVSENGEDIVSVDSAGKITTKGIGTAVITVKAETETSVGEAEYSITVTKKDVEISADDITWNPANKVYDGQNTVTLTGTAQSADFVSGEKIYVAAQVETAAADAGAYYTASISEVTVSDQEEGYANGNYNITLGNSLNKGENLSDLKVTITQRPLYIAVGKKDSSYQAELQYGHITETGLSEIVENYEIILANGTGVHTDETKEGVVEGEDVEGYLTTYASVSYALETESVVGDYPTALKAVIAQEANTNTGNYELKFVEEDEYCQSIKVIPEVTTDDEIWERIKVEGGIINGTGDDEIIWVRNGDSIKFSIDKTVCQNYDQVYVKYNGESYTDSIIIDEEAGKTMDLSTLVDGIYLKNSSDGDTRTTASSENSVDNQLPEEKIKVDNVKPVVTFQKLGGNGPIENYVFGGFATFFQTNHNETIKVSDEDSGIKEQTYKLVEITKCDDGTVGAAVLEAIKDTSGWQALTGTVKVPAVENSSKGYVILVKAVDIVGNEAIYTSDGTVIDLIAPEIALDITSKPSDDAIYNSDVAYRMTVKGPVGVLDSGIKEIQMSVTSAGEAQPGSWDQENQTYKGTDSYTIELPTNENGKYTFADLFEKQTYTVEGSIKCNSNDVDLQAVVTDMAGNKTWKEITDLKIDKTAPIITVEYNPEDNAGNGNNFQHRTMTVTYQERNFDPSKAVFDIIVDTGTGKIQSDKLPIVDSGEDQEEGSKPKSLGDIPGISVEFVSDTENQTEEGKRTDNRKVKYKITFQEEALDATYTIKPSVTDLAGNYAEASKSKFTIDAVPPEVEVSYDDNEPLNDRYFKERTMTITFKERNMYKDGITFDFQYGKNKLEMPGLKDEKITLEQLEQLAEEAGFEITIQDSAGLITANGSGDDGDGEEASLMKDRTLTVTIKFNGGKNGDMDYHIVPYMKDRAGLKNTEVTYADGTKAETDFTVDHKAPTITIDYFVEENGSRKSIDVSDDEIGRLYENQTIRAVVTINERNFSIDEESFSGEYEQVAPIFSWKQHNGEDGDVSAWNDAATNREKWRSSIDSNMGTDIYQQEFVFEDDGDYSFDLQYTDLAGNTLETDYVERYFTIDKTAPEISVVYKVDGQKIDPGDREENRLYKNKVITAEVTITERNFFREDNEAEFEKGQMVLKYTAKDTNSKETEIENYTKTANTRKEWTDGGEMYVREHTFEFLNDANYTFSIEYTDLAGNKTAEKEKYFTVDKTDPTGKITARNTVWEEFLEWITFGLFTNDSEKVTFEADDTTSGVAVQQYYLDTPASETRGEFAAMTVAELEAIDRSEWTDAQPITLDKEQQAVVYQKIVDRAGNVTYINMDKGIIVDKTKAAPEITITTAKPAHDIYNRNVDFTISVTDPLSGGTYSGLKEVYYEVRNNGERTQSGNYNAELEDWTARRHFLTKQETVRADINNSNNVQIWVKAVDYAGNVSEKTKDIKIDITRPTISVTYDNNSPLNGDYFNQTRTATVVVTERNFDPSAVRFTITNTDGTQPSISGWSSSGGAGVSDSATHTCYVTFAADGDYTFTLNTTDLAGNASQYTKTDEFTIDKTEPTIEVAYDNNNAATPGYFNKSRTATVTVHEHNFNAAEVEAAITASLQGSGVAAPGLGGWSNSGDVHSASVTFSADADYTFDVDYTDLAGNAAADYTQDQFTIDQTAPEIEIFDIEDKSANNNVVAPGVNYSDVNYDESGVEITLKGVYHDAVALDGARSSIANGQSIKMADFPRTEETDDLYTLKAAVVDKAGNRTEDSVTFSVNRFGSVYVFSDETQELLDKYYTNKEQDLVVTEINVDTLEHRGISYGRDGELTTLQEGTDYTVKGSGNEASWKQYQYRIRKENFEQEGNYTVTIDSRDRATNVVNNKIKGKDLNFVIDKTKPTVVITGIENGEQYRADSRDMTVNVTDNIAVGGLDIYAGDMDHASQRYTAEQIGQSKGEITYTIKNASSFQDIRAVAVDAAGNEAETEHFRVLVTSNLLIQYYSNKPLFIGSIIAVVAIAGIIWFLVAKRKKEREE